MRALGDGVRRYRGDGFRMGVGPARDDGELDGSGDNRGSSTDAPFLDVVRREGGGGGRGDDARWNVKVFGD